MEFSQIVMSAVCAAIGIALAGQLAAWQHRRAERDAAAGRPVVVPASIRRAGRTLLAGRWRHGTVHIHQGRVVWSPRTPWGRTLPIATAGYADRRAPNDPLRWQLSSTAVVLPCAEPASYELAVQPQSVKFLYRAQFV